MDYTASITLWRHDILVAMIQLYQIDVFRIMQYKSYSISTLVVFSVAAATFPSIQGLKI